ncbi:MAG TPA: tyrosine-type recombinase/integrase [Planctomicrobium sp.]|nr:tyrosine-type recombinase/integrase [Planctomicrobium sp.]
MNYAERSKASGIRLELTPHNPRNCWKKKHEGKTHYFHHPLTQAGYQDALLDWVKLKASIDSKRPNAHVWHSHRELFQQVQKYWQQFGIPKPERKLAEQVDSFLAFIETKLEDTQLSSLIPFHEFTGNQFKSEFVVGGVLSRFGQIRELPEKWQDRISRLTKKEMMKEPQTIDYWLEKYLSRIEQRGGKYIVEKTAKDRQFKLIHLKKWADLQAHVSTIDDKWLEQYHDTVDSKVSDSTGKLLSKSSKEGYFKAVKMFIRWAATQSGCDLRLPANIDNRESGFRETSGTGRKREEKKKKLWTREEFITTLEKIPKPYNTALILMLNCGFRHVDVSELRKSDVHLDSGRIVVQRNKLNQQDRAPVISYPLWNKSIELLQATMGDRELVFQNSDGGKIEGSLKTWWTRNKKEYGNKRLDYLRKTGSTIIAKYDRNLDEMYLGENLSTTARVHYSFHDGDPNQALDDAIRFLGSEFGLAEAPAQAVHLTEEMRKVLEKAGFKM